MEISALIKLLIISLIAIWLISGTFVVFGSEDNDNEECKKVGNNHDGNKASEQKFYSLMNKTEFCDFVKMHDAEKIEGEIREDSKHDWHWFTSTKVWETAFEEAKFCMLERFDLPNNGKKTLGGYELEECGHSPDDY
jgi:hypothetical protein